MKNFSRSRKAFTLIEMMLVVGIISLLWAVLYPSVSGYIEGTRDASRRAALQNISLGLKNYFSDSNHYPEADRQGCVNKEELGRFMSQAGGGGYQKAPLIIIMKGAGIMENMAMER